MWRDTYRHVETAELAAIAGGVRGSHARHTEVDDTVPARWLEPPEAHELMLGDARWLGQFTPRGIPLVLAGRLLDTTIFFFAVSEDSCLKREGALINPLLPWQRIRVVGLMGKAW